MEQFILKISCAIIILGVAILGGFIPALSRKKDKIQPWLVNGEFFSRGVFLGAGLIHLLPDALNNLSQALPDNHYPIAMTICAATIFALQFIEQGALKLIPPCQNSRSWIVYLLMVLLSIHSIIAGTALGVSNTVADILIIFLAIIAHKGAAAFSLGVQMRNCGIKTNITLKIIILFSLMTPIGIMLGSFLDFYLFTSSGHLATGIFSAIAAGTFIYIATFGCSKITNEHQNRTTPSQILHVGLGILIMAVVAIWL